VIPTKLIALALVTFALVGLMIPAGVSKTAFAQGADEIIDNVESLVSSEEITEFLEEEDNYSNGEEEEAEAEEEEGDDGGGDGDGQGDDNQNIDQTQEQDQEAEQEVVDQDSSADDNVQTNTNTFGADTNLQVAVPIVDQDQTAEQRAVNLDIEIVREQQPPTQPTPSPPDDGVPPEEEEEDAVFCLTFRETGGGNAFPVCTATLEECESLEGGFQPDIGTVISECEGFDELPAGAACVRVELGSVVFTISCEELIS
jgi:hypothetical protein